MSILTEKKKMSKTELKGAALLAPLPVVMVSAGDFDNANIITVAWTGIVCSAPPRVYISVRRDRYSYGLLKKSGEFVINFTSESLLPACDYCGIRSGREIDKFSEMKFTKERASHTSAAMIKESPINLECKVFDVIELGSHDMFLADVLAVHVDESIMTDGKIDYKKAKLVNYQHGDYYSTGRQLGRFGFAAQRKFIVKYGKGLDVDVSQVRDLTKRKPLRKQ